MFKRLFGSKSETATKPTKTQTPPMWTWVVEEASGRGGEAITAGFLYDWSLALSQATFLLCRGFADSEAFPEFARMHTDKDLTLRVAAFASNWLTAMTISDHPELYMQDGKIDDVGHMIIRDMQNIGARMYPAEDPMLRRAIELHIREYSNPDAKLSSQLEMVYGFIAIATGEIPQLLPLSDEANDQEEKSLALKQYDDGMRRFLAFGPLLAARRSLPAEFLEKALADPAN
jgi:hypothetical protein